MLEPQNSGYILIILEFKLREPDGEKTLEDTVKEALAQIKRQNYSATLETEAILGLSPRLLRETFRIYGEGSRTSSGICVIPNLPVSAGEGLIKSIIMPGKEARYGKVFEQCGSF